MLHAVKIHGWIHQRVSTDPDAPVDFVFWAWKSDSADYIPICEHILETTVEVDRDKVIQSAVNILNLKAQVALETYTNEMAEINEKRSQLLALPLAKPISADSVGGADDEFADPLAGEVHNDGFAPDETSFG